MNPIILLHGALGSGSQLQSLAAQFERTGRKTFLLNFSGHGGTPFSEGFGIEVFAHDLLSFLSEKKIDTADIFGYSMGGYVALWSAYQQPQRFDKIVTLGTKFDWSPESAEKETKKLNSDKIEEKVPAFAKLLQQRHEPLDWKEVLKKTSAMMLTLGQKPLLTASILKAIQSPVHILQGDQDDMADSNFSKQVAAWLPLGKFELLLNTPHPIEKVDLHKVLEKIEPSA